MGRRYRRIVNRLKKNDSVSATESPGVRQERGPDEELARAGRKISRGKSQSSQPSLNKDMSSLTKKYRVRANFHLVLLFSRQDVAFPVTYLGVLSDRRRTRRLTFR